MVVFPYILRACEGWNFVFIIPCIQSNTHPHGEVGWMDVWMGEWMDGQMDK